MRSNVDMRREHASIRAGFVWNPDQQEELFQQEQLDEQQEEEQQELQIVPGTTAEQQEEGPQGKKPRWRSRDEAGAALEKVQQADDARIIELVAQTAERDAAREQRAVIRAERERSAERRAKRPSKA